LAVVNTIMNIRVPQDEGNILISSRQAFSQSHPPGGTQKSSAYVTELLNADAGLPSNQRSPHLSDQKTMAICGSSPSYDYVKTLCHDRKSVSVSTTAVTVTRPPCHSTAMRVARNNG
jgi:hypothetical protein